MNKRFPQAGYGPKANFKPVEKIRGLRADMLIIDDMEFRYHGTSTGRMTLDSFRAKYQQATRAWTGAVIPPTPLEQFGVACIEMRRPVSKSQWNSLNGKRQQFLFDECKRLAQSPKPKHEPWGRLWACYIGKVLTA